MNVKSGKHLVSSLLGCTVFTNALRVASISSSQGDSTEKKSTSNNRATHVRTTSSKRDNNSPSTCHDGVDDDAETYSSEQDSASGDILGDLIPTVGGVGAVRVVKRGLRVANGVTLGLFGRHSLTANDNISSPFDQLHESSSSSIESSEYKLQSESFDTNNCDFTTTTQALSWNTSATTDDLLDNILCDTSNTVLYWSDRDNASYWVRCSSSSSSAMT